MKKQKKSEEKQTRIPKQARAIAKYDAVLDACVQVLIEKGYAKSTILELSLASDVPVATIYQYFPDKESIFRAWLEHRIDQLFAFLKASQLDHSSNDLETYIKGLIKLSLDSISLFRESARKLILDLPHMLLSDMLSSIQDKTLEVVMEISATYLGEKPNQALQVKLKVLIRALLGFMIQYIMDSESHDDTAHLSTELTAMALPYLLTSISSDENH